MNKVYEKALKECPLIAMDEDYCNGQPRIKGHRITVADILNRLYEGKSCYSITSENCYPQLTRAQVNEAVLFAMIVMREGHNENT